MAAAAAPQSNPQPPSAEEEALKRNTDCVYFLASPLTCKKGSECEYRHSDIARVNPRDCWFWLHQSCLNPKCGFRHPPLDGLLGTEMPISAGPSQPLLQTVTTPSAHAVTSKQGVPCKFFQTGFCLKGDWCPFVHGPSSNSKASLMPGTASAIKPSTFKKVENSVQEKKVPPANMGKSNDFPNPRQVASELATNGYEHSINKRISGTSCINEFPDDNERPFSNGNRVSWSTRVHQSHLLDEPGMIDNSNAGELSREPSPGFDVLVDDEGRDSDFYHGEDQYGISREYDTGHLTDYTTVAEVENERYPDPRGYDSHVHRKGKYGLERNSASSERMSGGSSYLKRSYAMADNHGQIDELDLRHHLAKNKQRNGLRSVISHEDARGNNVDDRSYESLHGHERHISMHETSLSGRLRGRVRRPQRSLSPIGRGMIRSSDRDRLSPLRASKQGRIQGRLKGRVEEASTDSWRNDRGIPLRRGMIGDNNADFAGPKSLAELKNRKNAEPSEQHGMDQQQLGKRKYLVHAGHHQSGNDLSFEGPTPLEDILKRKRGETIGTVSHRNSSAHGATVENNNQKEGKDETNNKSVEKNMSASVERTEAKDGPVANKVEAKDGAIIESAIDQESYEQREESDFERYDREDLGSYDGDNGGGEGEYLDDDDDEFAKKMGVMYS